MTTLADLTALVYTHTNRPDLIAETKAAVKKATLKLHGMDFYKWDRKEVIISLPVQTIPRYQLDTSNGSYPLFRRVDTISPYDTTSPIQPFYDKREADDVIDGDLVERQNYFYQIGSAINLVIDAVRDKVKVGYFAYPNVTDAGYSSWIADQFPDAVAEDAARSVFKMIGKDEEFQRYESLTQENQHMITMAGV